MPRLPPFGGLPQRPRWRCIEWKGRCSRIRGHSVLLAVRCNRASVIPHPLPQQPLTPPYLLLAQHRLVLPKCRAHPQMRQIHQSRTKSLQAPQPQPLMARPLRQLRTLALIAACLTTRLSPLRLETPLGVPAPSQHPQKHSNACREWRRPQPRKLVGTEQQLLLRRVECALTFPNAR